MKVIHVVGARPNFMKIAPVYQALEQYPHVTQRLVHTGQHYDANMSDIFFKQLGLPQPDVNLGVGSGTHAGQTAQVMVKFEELVTAERPDWVVVYGDVNSTVAAALVCAKLLIPVAHVEAGLRSGDRTMPEEINRLLTDQLADLLFTPSLDGNENLAREGIPAHKIHFVGNVMIDTLVRLRPAAEELWPALCARYGLSRFGLVTLHRPSNVDQEASLRAILETLNEIGRDLPLFFPIHPRTRARLETWGLADRIPNIQLAEPLGYLDFVALQAHAALVLTDSGGVQEETTWLGTPCITLRANTERPITLTHGTNVLVGEDMLLLRRAAANALAGKMTRSEPPPLWDGHAGARVAAVLAAPKPAAPSAIAAETAIA